MERVRKVTSWPALEWGEHLSVAACSPCLRFFRMITQEQHFFSCWNGGSICTHYTDDVGLHFSGPRPAQRLPTSGLLDEECEHSSGTSEWSACRHGCRVSIIPRESSQHRRRRFSFAISLINAIVSAATLGLCEEAFDLRFQYRRKSSRCQREPRIWLNDEERLLPCPNSFS
jgi:hypothetical protein